jgi:hypothetical protein
VLQLEETRRRQVETGIDALEREFDGRIGRETVEAVGREVVHELLETARVADFIPGPHATLHARPTKR